jgi:hypothetical protein
MTCAERPGRAAAGAAVLVLLAAACSCDEARDGAAAGGGAGAGAGSDARDAEHEPDAAGDAADAPACPGAPGPRVPDGWVRFPGLPCECDVWMAPDAERMDRPPAWIPAGPGDLELEVSWATPANRLLAGWSRAASWGGHTYVAYARDLGKDLYDTLVVRLPENQPVFQSIVVGGVGAPCQAHVTAMGQGKVLHWAYVDGALGVATPVAYLEGLTTDGPLRTVYAAYEAALTGGDVVSSRVAARLHVPPWRIDAFTLDPPGIVPAVATGYFRDYSLVAWDDALYFERLFGAEATSRSEIQQWTAASGQRRFVPGGGAGAGGDGFACGFGTDGTTMLWEEGSGWNGAGWDRVDIMVAPYTPDPAQLAPRRLRASPGLHGAGCFSWKLGGGHAVGIVYGSIQADDRGVYVVRISDGMLWKVAPRSERRLTPLGVTAEEVILAEGVQGNDAGATTIHSWTIVRRSLSALGAGVRP